MIIKILAGMALGLMALIILLLTMAILAGIIEVKQAFRQKEIKND